MAALSKSKVIIVVKGPDRTDVAKTRLARDGRTSRQAEAIHLASGRPERLS